MSTLLRVLHTLHKFFPVLAYNSFIKDFMPLKSKSYCRYIGNNIIFIKYRTTQIIN